MPNTCFFFDFYLFVSMHFGFIIISQCNFTIYFENCRVQISSTLLINNAQNKFYPVKWRNNAKKTNNLWIILNSKWSEVKLLKSEVKFVEFCWSFSLRIHLLLCCYLPHCKQLANIKDHNIQFHIMILFLKHEFLRGVMTFLPHLNYNDH